MHIDPNPLAHLWHWIEIHTGAMNEAGSYYGWWSGFGSDLGEIAIVGGLITMVRHINCHTSRCWRIGKHSVDGTPYKVCRKHHPIVPTKGKITEQHIADAHSAANS